MKRTIQQLREERGESQEQLVTAIGVTPHVVVDWERGRAEPTVSRLQALAEHFGVRDDQITLRPQDPPSLGDRIADLLYGAHGSALCMMRPHGFHGGSRSARQEGHDASVPRTPVMRSRGSSPRMRRRPQLWNRRGRRSSRLASPRA